MEPSPEIESVGILIFDSLAHITISNHFLLFTDLLKEKLEGMSLNIRGDRDIWSKEKKSQ
jgi:hypothetical protein